MVRIVSQPWPTLIIFKKEQKNRRTETEFSFNISIIYINVLVPPAVILLDKLKIF